MFENNLKVSFYNIASEASYIDFLHSLVIIEDLLVIIEVH